MILDLEENEIILKAVDKCGTIVNGHAIYDTREEDESKRLKGISLFNNEIPHPNEDKYYIYLLTFKQNTNFSVDCYDCPFLDENYKDDFYDNKEDCCFHAWLDNEFENFEDNYRENIEFQIREIIDRIISDDLYKLNKIRIGIYEKFYSVVQYQEKLFNDNYMLNVLDNLVDNAYINGLYAYTTSKIFLEPYAHDLSNLLEVLMDESNLNSNEYDLAYKLSHALDAYELSHALKIIKKEEK